MPEHVHLLVSEPENGMLAKALQALKLSVAGQRSERPFWQARYYDFNVHSERKRVEKLRYMHRNPVARGLAAQPDDWAWSSFRHYWTGEESVVEIESPWTAARRDRATVEAQYVDGGDSGGNENIRQRFSGNEETCTAKDF